MQGHDGITAYWNEKVVEQQANIDFKLMNVYVDGQTAIAEWEARFDDLVMKKRWYMKEIAVLKFRGGKIASLHEYWSTIPLGDL